MFSTIAGRDIAIQQFEGATKKTMYDQTVYTLPNSSEAADFVRTLEDNGINNYEISSPTIEEIFFKVAEDASLADVSRQKSHTNTSTNGNVASAEELMTEGKVSSDGDSGQDLKLQTGKRIGAFRQAFTLFRKRFTVFQRNWFPYFAAFLIPVIAAGLVTLFLKNFQAAGCSPSQQISASDIESLLNQVDYEIVIGPSSKVSPADIARIGATLPGAGSGLDGGSGSLANLSSSIHVIDGTLDDFNEYINQRYANVTPGGFFLGDDTSPPTFAYKANGDLSLATITQNAFDTLLTNVSISTQYQAFDVPWVSGAGKSLQLVVYLGLAMACYPALFSLYPTLERLRSVRQLHYSNGIPTQLPICLPNTKSMYIRCSKCQSLVSLHHFRLHDRLGVQHHFDYHLSSCQQPMVSSGVPLRGLFLLWSCVYPFVLCYFPVFEKSAGRLCLCCWLSSVSIHPISV